MQSLNTLTIFSIVTLIIVTIIAIVVWTIVLIKYMKILRQRKIHRILDRIRERAEDSGNESDGDQEELSEYLEMGPLAPWNVDDLQ
uniref:Protein Vpu n=1 Tax=Human immunodeficiency virus type 1 TaxID=11676 RepID=A0A0A0UYG6_HV1|nr:vpu protein [Human immunodeficiency virus 1]